MLDTKLKLQPGEVSRELKPLLTLLGVQTSFDEATELAKKLLLVEISDKSIHKAVQWVSEKQDGLEAKWQQMRGDIIR